MCDAIDSPVAFWVIDADLHEPRHDVGAVDAARVLVDPFLCQLAGRLLVGSGRYEPVVAGAVDAGVRDDQDIGLPRETAQQGRIAAEERRRALDDRPAPEFPGLPQVRQRDLDDLFGVVAVPADLVGPGEVHEDVLVHEHHAQVAGRHRPGHGVHHTRSLGSGA